MAEQRAMLIIDPPNELRFVGPFKRPVITPLKLFNPTNHVMLFKIKTTAPKRYCVRPNFGCVLSNSFTMVEICLQPFTYDANEKNKHKFMVQSLIAPADCDDFNTLWKEALPDQLMDAKLKCVFEMPSASDTPEAAATGASSSANNEKWKAKEASKPLGEEKISNLQTSDQTDNLNVEFEQLREENSGLRKENLNLKEQVLRLRCSQTKPPMEEPYSPMIVAQKQIPSFYIALGIAAIIFGVLLGKYLL